MLGLLLKTKRQIKIKTISVIFLALYIFSGKSTFSINEYSIQTRYIFLSVFIVPVILHLRREILSRTIKRQLNLIVTLGFLLSMLLMVVVYGNKSTKNEYIVNILHLVVLNFALYILIKSFHDFNVILYSFVALGMTLLFFSVIGLNDPSGNLDFWNTERSYQKLSAMATPTVFSRLMFLSALSALVLASQQKSQISKFFLTFYSLVSILAAFQSKSIAAIVSYFSSVFFVCILLLMLEKFSKARRMFLAGTFVGVIGLASTLGSLNSKYEDRVKISFGTSTANVDSKEIIVDPIDFDDRAKLVLVDNSQRLSLAAHAVYLFDQSKFLGVGWGNYAYLGIVDYYEEVLGFYTYPHNILLEFFFFEV